MAPFCIVVRDQTQDMINSLHKSVVSHARDEDCWRKPLKEERPKTATTSLEGTDGNTKDRNRITSCSCLISLQIKPIAIQEAVEKGYNANCDRMPIKEKG